jgi:hypothetical protein
MGSKAPEDPRKAFIIGIIADAIAPSGQKVITSVAPAIFAAQCETYALSCRKSMHSIWAGTTVELLQLFLMMQGS